jgi:hypothetical protein
MKMRIKKGKIDTKDVQVKMEKKYIKKNFEPIFRSHKHSQKIIEILGIKKINMKIGGKCGKRLDLLNI